MCTYYEKNCRILSKIELGNEMQKEYNSDGNASRLKVRLFHGEDRALRGRCIMKYYIDSGNLGDIKRISSYFPLSGMTTNPEILSREKTNPYALYKKIHCEVPQIKQFHMQVVSLSADEIVKEACYMREQLTNGENAIAKDAFFVKIPVDKNGVKAMMKLRELGIAFTATGIFTAGQCLLAADLGAAFVAPYITPISTGGFEGMEVVRDAKSLFDRYGHTTQILGAGFSVESQIARAGLAGADIITAPAVIYDKFLNVPQTQVYTDRFINAFQDFAGKGKTLLDFV